MSDIAEKCKAAEEECILLRRDFHRHPELGLEEERTGLIVAGYLVALGMEVSRLNVTGVAGLLRGAHPGPTLLMRADMDALAIQEETGAEYSSTIDGKMHACGHDAHTAMMLTAAKILAAERETLRGNIKFVFQPNEEKAGAMAMIDEGVMANPDVDACVSMHIWNQLESGKIGVTIGPIMAGMRHFTLTVKGKGGHTANPQEAIDPVICSAAIIQAVQTIQTREISALNEPTVIMFGTIHGGTTSNVIPDEVTMEGTIRYLFAGDDNGENSPRGRFERVVAGICAAHRTEYELDFECGHPTLVNDPGMTAMLTGILSGEMADNLTIEPMASLAGEDFSEFAARAPGVFCFLGAGTPGQTNYPHHHPKFDIDESVLKHGVELLVRTALRYFETHRQSC